MPLRNCDPLTIWRYLPGVVHSDPDIRAGFQSNPENILLIGTQRVERGNRQLVVGWIGPAQDTKVSNSVGTPILRETLDGKQELGIAARYRDSIQRHFARTAWLALDN